MTPLKSSEVTRGHQQFFADNLRLRRARDIKVVSMCLSRQYASTDMQLGSRRDLDLRSNFELDPSRSYYTYMFRSVLTRQARWCQNHGSIISNTCVIVEKLFRSIMPFFDLSWPLTLKQLILGEIWRHLRKRAFQELSFVLFLDLT